MGIAQVVILIIGAILFTVSFLIPEKKTVETKENREQEEKLIKEILNQEMTAYRYEMEDAAKETVEHTKETTERYMDRVTNEKMMAISEYSDTVMEQIHKNHEEAMFLYDMLNNKHAQIKNTAAEINDTVKNVRHLSKEMAETVVMPKEIEVPLKTEVTSEVKVSPKATSFEPITPEKIQLTPSQKEQLSGKAPADNSVQKSTGGKATTKTKKNSGAKKTKDVEITFGTETGSMNSNDRILALHKAGKSNMAIARELGLGIGEVKLVIDLFEGIS